jgi:hypothetical protein
MKRYMVMAVVSIIVAAGSYMAFAQQDTNMPSRRPGRTMNRGMTQDANTPGARGRGMMGGGMAQRRNMMGARMGMMRMCDTHRMVAQSIAQETIVPTTDGGVVIMVGNKLMKYDSSLNLIKEMELKIDYEAMQQQMQEMMEGCAGCKQMSQNKTESEATEPNSTRPSMRR